MNFAFLIPRRGATGAEIPITPLLSCSSGISSPDSELASLAISVIIDRSPSGENHADLQKSIKRACKTIEDNIQRGDQVQIKAISGDQPLFEDLLPANPTKVRNECKEKGEKSAKKGTFACDAVKQAHKSLEASQNVPILVSLIHTTEQETFCPSVWQDIATMVHKRGGKVLIFNATNEGERFEENLQAALGDLPSVNFHHSDVDQALRINLKAARQGENYARKP